MRVHVRELEYSSSRDVELIDVTEDVERVVEESGVSAGICVISVPHATAALVVNENEKGLIEDMKDKISEIFPKGRGYEHDRIDDNAHAHLASAFLGPSKVLPVHGGKLVRGAWQNIFLVELDGPRNVRRLVVTVLGE
ncbi:MAG: secondary thiamine-phosphate synthase enzyme YjbQ [Nitrososphaeria archaeon]